MSYFRQQSTLLNQANNYIKVAEIYNAHHFFKFRN